MFCRGNGFINQLQSVLNYSRTLDLEYNVPLLGPQLVTFHAT